MGTISQNTPVTAASIVAAFGGILAAFTGLGVEQVAALQAVVGILAAFAVQRWGTDPKS